MYKSLAATLLAFASTCTLAMDDEPLEVTFELIAPGLAADAPVHISGDIPQLGNWQPGAVKMEYAGNETWRKTITMDAPRSVEYKYTLGTWEREGADGNGNSLMNFTARVKGDITITEAVVAWTKGERKFEIKGQVTGTLERHAGMQGEGILDRDVIVWLPPGYETDSDQRYGVVYMHDGQNIIDPATANFGVDWEVDETADRLIREGAIPPVIVVGMNSTGDRTEEYSPGAKGEAYMSFVVNTVKPYIDANYRTRPGREHTVVGGSSMGGLVSFMLAWQYPEMFSAAICMSPAFKIRGHDFMSPVLASDTPEPLPFLYIDNGGIGLEEDLQPGIDEMIAELQKRGFEEGKDYVLTVDPDARHFEAAWAERMPGALELALRK
jgi:predicted alpha/beta superfamily hydrolase